MMPATTIKIGKREISLNSPVYFIAEIGSNFDGDLNRAKDLIYLAKESGADAAKFQHYAADSLVSDVGFKHLGAPMSHQSLWKRSVFQTYEAASLNKDWSLELKATCDKAGIDFLTSPYSPDLVDYVSDFVPAFKVGSGDITWLDIIVKMSQYPKPIMLATGASDLNEVRQAVEAVLIYNQQLILMQCNTNYTANLDNFRHVQLNVLKLYEKEFPGVMLGLSDHTAGHISVLGAVALGVRVIEKHFTDSNDRPGPDHAFAMTPSPWREMVDRTNDLQACLGDGIKRVEDNEQETVIVQRRALRAVCDLQVGHVIQHSDLESLRPCPSGALSPAEVGHVVGLPLKKALLAGEHVTIDHVK